MKSQLIRDLDTGLKRGEILPYFQPLINLRTRELKGFEVLARWHHPQLGVLLPAEFIALAEQSDLIGKLTEQTVCMAFAAARSMPPGIELSINISAIQLRDTTLPRRIAQMARSAGFSLNRLTVEITETALVDNIELALQVATEFKLLGAKLALDDFGTGYSSLTHLQALPFDELKVDRSFVSSMVQSRENRKIVSAVLGLGRSLGLMTVAEGVETHEQAEMLAWLGCDLAQGWLYGKAIAPEQVGAFCREFAVPERVSGMHTIADPTIGLDALPSQRYAQLQAIYDGAPVGLCFLDCDLRYVNINRQLAELNCLPVEMHLGRKVEEVMPAKIFSLVFPCLQRCLAGEEGVTLEIQMPAREPKGEPGCWFSSYQPARDEVGEIVGISVAIVDMSESRKQAAALQASEDHFRNMVELNPLVHWSMDPDGSNTVISSQWEKITGVPNDQSHHVGWLREVHEQDFRRISEQCFQALATGEAIDVEYRVSNGHGGWHWVRSRGAPLQDAEGNISKWYGCVELIDEQKEVRATLTEMTAQLAAIIENVPVGILIAEAPSGRIISRNSQAKEMFHEEVELTGINDYGRRTAYGHNGQIVTADAFPLARAIRHGKTSKAELCFREGDEPDGRWITVTGTPIRNDSGEVIGAISTLMEIEAA